MSLLKRICVGVLGLALALPAAAYSPSSNLPKITPATTFSQFVAYLPKTTHYSFGSSATAPTDCAASGTCAAITNSTQLGTYFNPYEVNTGTITVNSEMERYQTFASSSNFVFNSNNLQLTGTLGAGGTATVTASGSTSSSTSSGSTNSFLDSDCQMGSTSGITVGQLFNQTFQGNYVVTSVNSTTITTSPLFGAGTSLSTFIPCAFPPIYYATTNAATAGSGSTPTTGTSVLNFASVPSGVATGQTVGFVVNGAETSNQQYAVTGKTSTTVTISPSLALNDSVSSGEGIFFMPPINSAEMWTKNTFNMPGQNGATYFAMRMKVQLPQNATGWFGNIPGAPSTGNYAAFPAWWLRADYTIPVSGSDAYSELDAFEFYNNAFRTMKMWDVNVINAGVQGGGSPLPTYADYLYEPPLWSVTQSAYNGNPIYTYDSTTDLSTAPQVFGVILTPTEEYVFLNDVLMKSVPWHWTSPQSPQMGVDLAIGLLSGQGTNGQFPINNSNFPETLNVYSIEAWGK